MSDLPTADEFFGKPAAPAKPGALPTADEFFAAPEPVNTNAVALGGADMDEHFSQGSVGQILDWFGQGVRQGWGSEPLGLSQQQEKELRDAGIFKDYETGRTGLAREFNEAVIRPSAAVLDFLARRLPGVVHGIATEVPGLGPLAAGMEAFPAGHFTGFPAAVPVLPRAADLGVIGRGDAGYFDHAAIEALTPNREAIARPVTAEPMGPPDLRGGGGEVAGQFVQPTTADVTMPPAPDIHAVARQIAPDTFAEYDALSARKDTFRGWLEELGAARSDSEPAQALQGQIDDILGKVGGVEAKLTKAAAGRLQAARAQLDTLLRTDTPDMAKVRQDLLKTDIQMRDLAPDVSAAYRQASEQFPPPEAQAETAPAVPNAEAPVAESVPAATPASATEQAAPAPPEAAVTAPEPAPAPAATPAATPAVAAEAAKPPTAPLEGGIAGDVSKQLVAAGRPAEEADAAAALVQAHYEARAERFDGKLGTAEDLYRADAPNVRAGRGVQPAMELAQRQGEFEQVKRGSIRLATDQAKATITLFKDADASTFIHETGHQWLEELMSDAAHPEAPADLTADAGAVRKWLGVEDGAEIPRRAHEKFARGFERYMMEGHAPTQALADVFAKFRAWLTKIYQTVTQLRAPINDDIRGVFDRLIATSGERPVVAPERPAMFTPAEFVTTGAESRYRPVPREPLRLNDFLRREGGVRNERGEIAHVIGSTDRRLHKGLINDQRGMSLDDAALRAWEEGYFPDHGANRPTINDLLDAIREDSMGQARYSFRDEAQINAYRDALQHNAEVDRLAAAMGVRANDFTRQQFFDMAAEHLSLEERAREIGAMDAEAERALSDAEARAREALGDAWEPDAIYDSVPRSLEDLENEYKSEAAAAGNAPEGAGSAVEPGPAAAGEGPVQAGVRQGGRGAGPAGRGGAAAGEAPVRPHDAFGPVDDGLIDKAGNIRLDNLNAPDDIDAVIRDAAERHAGYVDERRGVITDGQMLDLADALGKDPAFLDEKKIGAAFSAEEVLAARQLLVQSATAVRDAMVAAAKGGDAELAALAQAVTRHEMIQGKVAQATAEWGRAGRAFRALEGWEQARDLNQLLKDNTGRTLNQLKQLAQLGQSLKTPAQVSKLVADSMGGKVRQAIIYYWVNTLISGPITHATYSVGNAVNALWAPLVETPIAAASGAVREALGVTAADRVYFNEATAQLYGLGKGFREGIAAAVEAYKSGVSPPLPSERIPAQFLTPQQPPIPGPIGRAIGLPGKSVAAIHSFFKSLRYEQNIQALAMRDALDRGLDGNARDLHVARLTATPTAEMMDQAVADALKELYMRRQPYNSAGAYLARATNSFLPAKIIAPFVKIGSEIVRNAFVERTPLGLGSAEVRGNLLGREGGAAFDMQLGKVMAGTGLMAATMIGVIEGAITGDGPSDPNERRVWLLTHRPTHVAIGPLTFDYGRLGHLAMLTRFAANMTETARSWDDKDGPKLAHAFFDGISRSVLDETWMRGVKDFFDAIYHPDEHFDSWVTRFVAQWTPYSIGLGQVARKVDPYQRETRDLTTAAEIFNQVKAHTPGLSQTLPPRRDIFGEPITNDSGTVDRYANDPVAKAMDALHIGIAPVKRDIRGVPLTPQQYDDYSRIAGRFAKMQLDAMVTPGFGSLPMETRIGMVRNTVSHAREAAAAQIMMQSVGGANDIIQKATDSKAAALQGAPPVEVKAKLKAH